MASDALYAELAKALSRPSKAYRAASAALDIPKHGLEGYEYGANFADKQQERKFNSQTLSEALGGQAPEDLQPYAHMRVKQAVSLAPLLKALQEPEEKSSQANFLVNGKLMRFRRGGYEEAPVTMSSDSTPPKATPAGTPGQSVPYTTTPRVPPTVPQGVLEKSENERELIRLMGEVKTNYSPSFTGPLEGRLTSLKQKVGVGDTAKAARFQRSLADLRDLVARERSGAAIGERNEWDRLMMLIPDDKKSDKSFAATLPAFESKLNSILRNRQQAYQEAGYRTGGIDFGRKSDPNASTGDPEADAAIQTVMQSTAPDAEKQARVQAIRAEAAR